MDYKCIQKANPEEVLAHHGIKGQRWGFRRFQNKDGSYTDAGRKRYGIGDGEDSKVVEQSKKAQNPQKGRVNLSESSVRNKAEAIAKEIEKYREKGPNGNQNSQLAMWALESRFRGKDILPRPVYSPRDPAASKKGYDIVKNPEKQSVSGFEDVDSKIKEAGPGSRFYLHLKQKSNLEDDLMAMNINGTVHLVDPTDGFMNKMDNTVKNLFFKDPKYSQSYMVRLDDKDIDPEVSKLNDKKYMTQWDSKKDLEYFKRQGYSDDRLYALSERKKSIDKPGYDSPLRVSYGKTLRNVDGSLTKDGLKAYRTIVKDWKNNPNDEFGQKAVNYLSLTMSGLDIGLRAEYFKSGKEYADWYIGQYKNAKNKRAVATKFYAKNGENWVEEFIKKTESDVLKDAGRNIDKAKNSFLEASKNGTGPFDQKTSKRMVRAINRAFDLDGLLGYEMTRLYEKYGSSASKNLTWEDFKRDLEESKRITREVMKEDHIAHHGIKGQKWGFRRFQNEDGSLTEAGKRRYQKLSDQEERIQRQKRELVGNKSDDRPKNPHGKKSIFDMTDDELNFEINRLGLEKRYKDLMRDVYPVKKTERYFNGKKVAGEIMTRGLTSVGSNVVERFTGAQVNRLGKALGLDYNLYTKEQQKKKES